MTNTDPPTPQPLRAERHAAILLALYVRELAAQSRPVAAPAGAHS